MRRQVPRGALLPSVTRDARAHACGSVTTGGFAPNLTAAGTIVSYCIHRFSGHPGAPGEGHQHEGYRPCGRGH